MVIDFECDARFYSHLMWLFSDYLSIHLRDHQIATIPSTNSIMNEWKI